MEWSSIDWNSTIPEVFEALLDKWSDQSGQLSKFLFDNCVLPVGQYLLSSAERAVQYTLNGEYEVTRGERQIKCHRLILSHYYDFSWVVGFCSLLALVVGILKERVKTCGNFAGPVFKFSL